jgi:copper chaperone CopZ
VRTVTEALTSIEGVEQVTADVMTKQVRVDYDETSADIEQMQAVLADEDYPVAAVAR